MTIHINELSFETIIGILPFERENKQKVIINLEAEYVYLDNEFVDYAQIVELIISTMDEKKFELIEEALEELKSIIFTNFKQINKIFIKITKPDIIKNCNVSVSLNSLRNP